MASHVRGYADETTILERLKSRLQVLKTDAADPSVSAFIPESSLDQFYNHDEVKEILKEPIFDVPPHKRAATTDVIIKYAPKVFSILLELNHEQGLIPLIENDLLDSSLPLDMAMLCKVIPGAAASFDSLQWSYKAYHLRSGLYHKQLAKQQILPFLSRTKIGGGGYSAVYRIVIHQRHQNVLPFTQTDGVTAIEKQLQPPLKDAKAEAELLFLLRTIKHPNLVELLASYTYDGLTSLIFAPADMDLHEFLLRPDRFDAFIHDSSTVQAIQGLTSGLAYLHNFRPRPGSLPDQSETCLHGYHHDIKPRNILVFGSSLVLADFGFSRLKTEDQDTQTTWKHTTFEYGAPECRDMVTLEAGKIGRRSDIWSLACVISEILTHLQFGDEGIKSFRESRITEDQYGYIRCFHDGKNISTVVDQQLSNIEIATTSDAIRTAIRTVRPMFSGIPGDRPCADAIERRLARASVLALVERLSITIERLLNDNNIVTARSVSMAHLRLEHTNLRAWCHALGLKTRDGSERPDYSQTLIANRDIHRILEAACNEILNAPAFGSDEDHFDFILTMLSRMNRSIYTQLSPDARSSVDNNFQILLASTMDTLALQPLISSETGVVEYEVSTVAAMRYMTLLLEKQDKEMARGHRIESDLIREVSATADLSVRPPIWEYRQGYNEEESRKVLAEFIPYWERKHNHKDANEFESAIEAMFWRVQELAGLLTFQRKPTQLRTLPCLGTFHHAPRQRFGLIYGFPLENSMPIRLNKLLSRGKHSILYPDLARRLELAKALVSCVQTFHSAGWLHKNISSFNILFFPQPPNDWTAVNLGEPYIIGFDHSRPDGRNEYSQGPILGSSKEYLHPDYRLKKVGFRRAFDYYALGLVLLEIGTWNSLSNVYENHPDWAPGRLTEAYVENCAKNLSCFMGPTYQKATMECLRHDFGPDEEEQLTFQAKVVDEINTCHF